MERNEKTDADEEQWEVSKTLKITDATDRNMSVWFKNPVLESHESTASRFKFLFPFKVYDLNMTALFTVASKHKPIHTLYCIR